MLRRLIGTEDRDPYLRPAEYDLVQEARELLGDLPSKPSEPEGGYEDEPLGDDRSPDFGPEGIINAVGVPVVEPTARRASSPPAPPAPPASTSRTGRVVLGDVMRVPPAAGAAAGAVGAAGVVVDAPSETPGPDALPYAPPPVVRKEEPYEGILLFRFPLTIGMPADLTVSEQPREVCRVHQLRTNAPCAGFGRLEELKFGNLHLLYDGTDFTHPDLHFYAKGQSLQTRAMQPFDRVIRVRVVYTGHVPEGMFTGQAFLLEVLLEGRVRRS